MARSKSKAKTESTASSSSAKTKDTQVENTGIFGPYGTKAKEFQRNKELRQICKAFDERQAAWRDQHPDKSIKRVWDRKVEIAKEAIAKEKAKQNL